MPEALRWIVAIPVKPPAVGKSRLGGRPELAEALALDTIAAAAAAAAVARVIVVTADPVFASRAAAFGEIVLEEAPAGIAVALDRAFAAVPVDAARAALLGDLPALHPAELSAALAGADAAPRAYLADAEGTGTTLVTAAPGIPFSAHFGPASAAAHALAGFAPLTAPAGGGLRRDVDDPAQLAAVREFLGPRTRAELARAQPTAS